MEKPDLEKFLNNQCSLREAQIIIREILAGRISIDEVDIFEDLHREDYAQVDHHFKNQLRKEYFGNSLILLRSISVRIVAAAVILLTLCIGELNRTSKLELGPVKVVHSNWSLQPKVIYLPDSSRLEMEPESVIILAEKFADNRVIDQFLGHVTYFVKKNQVSPFRVRLNGFETEAIGTTFTIEKHANRLIDVILHEGKVAVKDLSNNIAESIYLTQGQSLRIQEDYSSTIHEITSKKETSTWNIELFKSKSSISNSNLQWTNNFVSFSKVNIHEVFHIIENLFDVKVVLATDEISGSSFTGDIYRTDNLTKLMENISKLIGFHYTIENGLVTIKAKEEEQL